MNTPTPALERARKTALWGQWLCGLMTALIAVIVILFTVLLAAGHPAALAEFSDMLDNTEPTPLASIPQAVLLGLLWMAPDLVGLAVTVWAFGLFRGFRQGGFRGFRQGGFLTSQTALRLRRIGWGILAMAPVRILTEAAALALYSMWTPPVGGSLRFGLEDTDFYAVMIGLIVLTTGHLMVQAVEISAENESFV